MVFRTMVYAAVIGFIFNSMCRFRRRKTEMYYIQLTYGYTYRAIVAVYVYTIQ